MSSQKTETHWQARASEVGLREQLEQANGPAAVAEARADFADQAFAACQAEGEELRERVDELTAKLADAQAELAAAQDQAEAASARAVAAVEAEQALRQADAIRRARPLWQRLKAAWLAE
jgi:uncharacterized coiled-coil DUF342 family protein